MSKLGLVKKSSLIVGLVLAMSSSVYAADGAELRHAHALQVLWANGGSRSELRRVGCVAQGPLHARRSATGLPLD